MGIRDQVAITHPDLLENFPSVCSLRYKYSRLLLLDLETEKVSHHPEVCHLKLKLHFSLELVNKPLVVTHEDQIINIQCDNQEFIFTFLHVDGCFEGTLFEAIFLEIAVNLIVLRSRGLF
jgi:hypothetical protein